MNKKTLGILFLAIYAIFILFNSNTVSAKSPFELISEKISGVEFDAGFSDNVKEVVARIVFFVIVWVITFSIAGELPFVEGRTGPSFILSLAITILGNLFLPYEAIYAIALSYNAYSIAITLIIPFIAISVASRKQYLKGRIFISKLLWSTYLVGLFLLFFIDLPSGMESSDYWAWILAIYGLAMSFALLMLFFEGWFYSHILMRSYESQLEAGELRSRMASMASTEARLRKLEEDIVKLSPTRDRDAYNAMKQEIEDLREYIKGQAVKNTKT